MYMYYIMTIHKLLKSYKPLDGNEKLGSDAKN